MVDATNVSKEVLKVILLGNGGVGKSSLMRRYVKNMFEEKTLHTIGVEFLNKNITCDNKSFTLQIWDTGGQERFKSLRTPFYRGSDICILVFDLTNNESFLDIDYWLEEFQKYAELDENIEFPFLLVGNKADLAERAIDSQEIFGWCKNHNSMPYLETSAKLDINVENGFMTMVTRVVQVETKNTRSGTGSLFNDVILLNRSTGTHKKKCCDQ